jgi:dipeptide/tripeptide permease
VYLTQVFHMRSVDAATLLNGLNGTTSLAPIIGAFLSDAYLGRYLALAIASIASLIVSFNFFSSPLLPFPSLPFPSLMMTLIWSWGGPPGKAETDDGAAVGGYRVRFS